MTPTQLTILVDRLLVDLENEVIEFKTASKHYSADKTGESVSAIANEANLRGLAARWVIFGIDNDLADAAAKAGCVRKRGFDSFRSLTTRLNRMDG